MRERAPLTPRHGGAPGSRAPPAPPDEVAALGYDARMRTILPVTDPTRPWTLPLLGALLLASTAGCRPSKTPEEDRGRVISDDGGGSDGGDGGSGTDSGTTDGGDGMVDGGGDGTDGTDGTDGGGDTGAPDPDVDYRGSGPWGDVIATEGSYDTDTDCALDYTVYEPNGTIPAGVVFLAHGFVRSQAQMEGWATQLSSWGLIVVTPNLCHSSAFDVNPEENAADMIELAGHLGYTGVVWVGHSAGGLAALLAGAADPSASAVLGLDPVEAFGADSSSVGASLTVPAAFFLGESSACNASNSGRVPYEAAPDHVGWRVTEADHCDFESPTDGLCTFACTGTNEDFSDSDIQETLGGLMTSWAMLSLGLDPGAASWWQSGGTWNDSLQASGAISAP